MERIIIDCLIFQCIIFRNDTTLVVANDVDILSLFKGVDLKINRNKSHFLEKGNLKSSVGGSHFNLRNYINLR